MDKKDKNRFGALFVMLIFANAFCWYAVFASQRIKGTEFYFFNVGQGDSQMIRLGSDVEILIDGGPKNKILEELPKVMAPSDKYIDIVVLTHPHEDHYAGLINVLKNYSIGAFVYSGINSQAQGFKELAKIIKEKNIKYFSLEEGDGIRQGSNKIFILSPSNLEKPNKDLNVSSMVLKFENENANALFMADVDKKVEERLAQKYDLKTDILKMAHHGSKNSLSYLFLGAAGPKISVFEVGKNSYGHPSLAVIEELKNIRSKIFRTDKDGTIKIIADNGSLEIFNAVR